MKQILFAVLMVMLFAVPSEAIQASFLYTLSDFTGPVAIGGGRVFVDNYKKETYVIYQNIIRIFTDNGMQIYEFNNENQLGQVSAGGVAEDGTIYLLSHDWNTGEYLILRCNYRGELKSKIYITGQPKDFASAEDFSPSRMVFQNNQFYLADARTMRVAIADIDGKILKGIDVFDALTFDEKTKRIDNEFGGFWADKDGKMYFTMPSQFLAGMVSTDGKVISFGRAGDLPGSFNIVGGITTDNQGNILITDKLKSAIEIFDKDSKFVYMFGERGKEEENLINPDDVVVDSTNRLFITQGASRGLSVYLLQY